MSMKVTLKESRSFRLSATTTFDPPLILTRKKASRRGRWEDGRRVFDLIENISKQAIQEVTYRTTYDVLAGQENLYIGGGIALGYNILKSGEKGALVRWNYGITDRNLSLSEADEARWKGACEQTETALWEMIREGLKERGL